MDAEVQYHHPSPDEPQRCEALQVALDLIDQGITLVDKDLKLVVWNRCFLRLFDFPPEMAYPGAPFESFVRYNALRGEYGPGDPQVQTAERVAMARSLEEYDLERTRPNGTVLSVRGMAVPGRGLMTFYSDVTDARHREALIREQNAWLEARVAERTAELLQTNAHLRQALERNEAIALSLVRSEGRMRLITDSIPALLAYFGHDRHYHYVNRGYRDWFGIDPAALPGQHLREVLGEALHADLGPHIAAALMGDPNASIPTPQPVHYRPMFGAYGGALARSSLTFVSQAGLDAGIGARFGLQKRLVAVKGCRSANKAAMRLNDYAPRMEIDAQTYAVRADGQLLTCEPAHNLPMAQRYFLF